MSGPKHSEWQVLENARLEAARRAAALAEIEGLEGRFEVTLATVREERADLAAAISGSLARLRRPTDSASFDTLAAFTARLRALLSEAETAGARIAASRETEARLTGFTQLALAELRKMTELGAKARLQEQESRKASLASLLDRAPPVMSGEERAAIDQLALEIMQAGAGRARVLELEIRAEIEAARRREAGRAELREEAGALRAMLLGYDEGEAKRLSARLAAIEAGAIPFEAELRHSVLTTTKRVKAEADRQYAAEVLREEFVALGYDVGDEFTVAVVGGGDVRIQHPAQGAYSVDLRFAPHAVELEAELVVSADRPPAAQAERRRQDRAAEEQWCNDLAQVFAGAEARKVQGRLRKRVPIGAQLVREVGTARGTRGNANRGIERSLKV